jgi:hypothetical protein
MSPRNDKVVCTYFTTFTVCKAVIISIDADIILDYARSVSKQTVRLNVKGHI